MASRAEYPRSDARTRYVNVSANSTGGRGLMTSHEITHFPLRRGTAANIRWVFCFGLCGSSAHMEAPAEENSELGTIAEIAGT